MLEKSLRSSLMQHTRTVVPGEAITVLTAWSSSTLHNQLLLEVLKIAAMDFYSLPLFLWLHHLQLRTWSLPGAHKLIACCPSQLPSYLVFWAAKQRVQQELISTKISLVATLKYADIFSCTHTMFSLALTCYYFALPPVFVPLVNLSAFINEFVGTEAH